jgi:hypothetical protein
MDKRHHLEQLQQAEWMNNRSPTILTAAEAYPLRNGGNDFYVVLWWGELLVGFIRFKFSPNQVTGELGYNIMLKVDRQALKDKPDIMAADEYVMMFPG